MFLKRYSSNYITKKEPKSDAQGYINLPVFIYLADARLSKLDWHDISQFFLTIMLLDNLKVF